MTKSLLRWMVQPVAGGAATGPGSDSRSGTGGSWIAVFVAALLMVASAAIHIHLWDIAYRHVATLGPLFMVQADVALFGAVALVVLRWVAVAIGCAALMLGTVVGFVLADTVGIFGFKLPVVTRWAYGSLVVEVLSAVLLGILIARSWLHRRSGSPSERGSGPVGMVRA
jgi:hypothetical protein